MQTYWMDCTYNSIMPKWTHQVTSKNRYHSSHSLRLGSPGSYWEWWSWHEKLSLRPPLFGKFMIWLTATLFSMCRKPLRPAWQYQPRIISSISPVSPVSLVSLVSLVSPKRLKQPIMILRVRELKILQTASAVSATRHMSVANSKYTTLTIAKITHGR